MADITYIFYLPPEAAVDNRDNTIPFNDEVAQLEGQHYMLTKQIAETQAKLEQVTTDLMDQQTPIREAAHEAAVRRQVEQEAREQAQADAEAAARVAADEAGADVSDAGKEFPSPDAGVATE
jgi:hypothetical protein